jgi:hypothetical protein
MVGWEAEGGSALISDDRHQRSEIRTEEILSVCMLKLHRRSEKQIPHFVRDDNLFFEDDPRNIGCGGRLQSD